MRISGSDAIIVMDNEVWYCIDGLPNLANVCQGLFSESCTEKRVH